MTRPHHFHRKAILQRITEQISPDGGAIFNAARGPFVSLAEVRGQRSAVIRALFTRLYVRSWWPLITLN